MKKILSSLAVVALASTFSANATETAAGCGLGAEVLEGKSGKGSNIAAAILNNLVIPNTFFMTTGGGLMGCDPTQTVEREQAKKIFAASHMDKLTVDAAKGTGDHLEALAYLIGIQEQDLGAFQRLTQKHHGELFSSDQPEALFVALDKALASDSDLSKYVNQ